MHLQSPSALTQTPYIVNMFQCIQEINFNLFISNTDINNTY